MINYIAIKEALIPILQAAWKPFAVGVGFLIVAHMIWYGPRIDNLKLEKQLANQQMEKFQSVIDSQNKAIENASTQSKQNFDDAFNDLESKIDQNMKDNENKLQNILQRSIPEGCDNVEQFLKDSLKDVSNDN